MERVNEGFQQQRKLANSSLNWKRTLCPLSQKGTRGEAIPAAWREWEKPQNYESHRNISTTANNVCICCQKAWSSGRRRRRLQFHVKEPPLPCSPPTSPQSKRSSQGASKQPTRPEIIRKVKAEPPGISLQRHNGTFWRNARCTSPHLKLRNLTFVFAAGVELACTQCPVLKLPVWKEEQLHIWERLGSNL